MPSIRLRTEPTVQQGQQILHRVERTLDELGFTTSRGRRDAVRFASPLPWRADHLSALLLASDGTVKVSAGRGGPRRLRYELGFRRLHLVVGPLVLAIVAAGWGWPRTLLLGTLLWVGLLTLALRVLADRSMRALLTVCAREIVERRSEARLADEGQAPVD